MEIVVDCMLSNAMCGHPLFLRPRTVFLFGRFTLVLVAIRPRFVSCSPTVDWYSVAVRSVRIGKGNVGTRVVLPGR